MNDVNIIGFSSDGDSRVRNTVNNKFFYNKQE